MIEVVDDIEQLDASADSQSVMHEVHRPDFIDRCRHRQWLWLFTNQSFPGFDSEVEFQLPVNAVLAFVVPAKALDVAQVQKAQPKAPVTMVLGQTDQSVGDFLVLGVVLAFVAITGLAD